VNIGIGHLFHRSFSSSIQENPRTLENKDFLWEMSFLSPNYQCRSTNSQQRLGFVLSSITLRLLCMLSNTSYTYSVLNTCTSKQRVNNNIIYKLEYLEVYGHASIAAFRQLSTHIVSPRSSVHLHCALCARGATKYTWSKV